MLFGSLPNLLRSVVELQAAAVVAFVATVAVVVGAAVPVV